MGPASAEPDITGSPCADSQLNRKSVKFYGDILGMSPYRFKVAGGTTRTAVKFG